MVKIYTILYRLFTSYYFYNAIDIVIIFIQY